MSRTLFSLAGFQVITIGRFWVIAEAAVQRFAGHCRERWNTSFRLGRHRPEQRGFKETDNGATAQGARSVPVLLPQIATYCRTAGRPLTCRIMAGLYADCVPSYNRDPRPHCLNEISLLYAHFAVAVISRIPSSPSPLGSPSRAAPCSTRPAWPVGLPAAVRSRPADDCNHSGAGER